jgi:hypothetical protein
MKTDFKVYRRKIHVWLVQNSNVTGSEHRSGLVYLHSTNAYPTCKAAIAAMKATRPQFEYRASFAKD